MRLPFSLIYSRFHAWNSLFYILTGHLARFPLHWFHFKNISCCKLFLAWRILSEFKFLKAILKVNNLIFKCILIIFLHRTHNNEFVNTIFLQAVRNIKLNAKRVHKFFFSVLSINTFCFHYHNRENAMNLLRNFCLPFIRITHCINCCPLSLLQWNISSKCCHKALVFPHYSLHWHIKFILHDFQLPLLSFNCHKSCY